MNASHAPGAGAPDPIVVLEGVTHAFDGRPALRGLDLAVRRGEMFGLIGPDGAGKTTTLRILVGLLGADAGNVTTCGLAPRHDRRALARRVGYLAQRFSLYGDLTVQENLGFFAAVQGVRGARERIDTLLDLVRLAPFRRRRAERLSGGMKQKLALAATLLHTPDLLVLDEPTTGVDPVSRRDFWRLLADIRGRGITIVVSTPYLDEAERCSRIALLSRGRLLGVDTPAAMRASLGGGWHELLAGPRREVERFLEARPDVSDVESFGERLHLRLTAGTGDGGRLVAALREQGFEVTDLRPVPPSLEDVFLTRIRAAEATEGAGAPGATAAAAEAAGATEGAP